MKGSGQVYVEILRCDDVLRFAFNVRFFSMTAYSSLSLFGVPFVSRELFSLGS